MSRIACIHNGLVMNVIVATQAFGHTYCNNQGWSGPAIDVGDLPVSNSWTYDAGIFSAPNAPPPVEPDPPMVYRGKHTTDANGQFTVNLPRAGMVLTITPRTSGAVCDGVVESIAVVNGKQQPQAVVKFKRMRMAAISITGLLNLSLLETNTNPINFDVVAEMPE